MAAKNTSQPNVSFSFSVSGGIGVVQIGASVGIGTAPYIPWNSNSKSLMQELAAVLSKEFSTNITPGMLPGVFGAIANAVETMKSLDCYSGKG